MEELLASDKNRYSKSFGKVFEDVVSTGEPEELLKVFWTIMKTKEPPDLHAVFSRALGRAARKGTVKYDADTHQHILDSLRSKLTAE